MKIKLNFISIKNQIALFFGGYFIFFLLTVLVTGGKSLLPDTLYVFSALIATLVGLLVVKLYGFKHPRGQVLLYFSTGLFLWFIAEATWVFLDFFSLEKPYPSIADIFFILAYPLLFIGLVKEIRIGKIRWKSQRTLPIIAIATILGLLVFYFGVYSAFNPEDDAISNVFSIFYGLSDLILLFAGLLIIFVIVDYRQGKLFAPWLSILAGIFLTLIADVIFSIYEEAYMQNDFWVTKIDLLWTGGYLFIGYGLALIALSLKEMREKIIANLNGNKKKKRPKS